MAEFKPGSEFACPGCGIPLSQLPGDHSFALDDSGATICGNGVKPMEYRVEAWGGGSGTDG